MKYSNPSYATDSDHSYLDPAISLKQNAENGRQDELSTPQMEPQQDTGVEIKNQTAS